MTDTKKRQINILLDEKKHEKLRIKLIKSKKSLAGWFRELVDMFIGEVE